MGVFSSSKPQALAVYAVLPILPRYGQYGLQQARWARMKAQGATEAHSCGVASAADESSAGDPLGSSRLQSRLLT